MGPDFPGLKPSVKVEVGDQVALGQTLIEDKQRAGVRYTAPAGGTVTAIHRGERRALVSVVIAVAEHEAQAPFESFKGPGPARDAGRCARCCSSPGCGPRCGHDRSAALRRPIRLPAAIFVTATDTRPHAVRRQRSSPGARRTSRLAWRHWSRWRRKSMPASPRGIASVRRRGWRWSSSPARIPAATPGGTYTSCCPSGCIAASGTSATRTSPPSAACRTGELDVERVDLPCRPRRRAARACCAPGWAPRLDELLAANCARRAARDLGLGARRPHRDRARPTAFSAAITCRSPRCPKGGGASCSAGSRRAPRSSRSPASCSAPSPRAPLRVHHDHQRLAARDGADRLLRGGDALRHAADLPAARADHRRRSSAPRQLGCAGTRRGGPRAVHLRLPRQDRLRAAAARAARPHREGGD